MTQLPDKSSYVPLRERPNPRRTVSFSPRTEESARTMMSPREEESRTVGARSSLRRGRSINNALHESGLDTDLIANIERLAASGTRSWHVGSNPKFMHSIELACRVALACAVAGYLDTGALLAAEQVPETWQKYLPTIIVVIVLSAKENLASTMMSMCQVQAGTVLAVAHAYVICHALPQNHFAIAIAVYSIFTFFILWLNLANKVRIFTLTWTAYLVMQFTSPEVDLRQFMVFQWDSEMVAILVVQFAGSMLALLASLLPYPMTALAQAKVMAAKTATTTTRMYMYVVSYYCGIQADLAINIWRSELVRLRNLELTMHDTVEAAWWEGFDLCDVGLRKLLKKHVKTLREMTRQLNIFHCCALREDFAQSHVKIMKPVEQVIKEVVQRMGELLMSVTIDASDGIFDEREAAKTETRIEELNDLLTKLADKWQDVRATVSSEGIGLAKELRTESFFVYQLTKCSRLVAELGVASITTSKSRLDFEADEAFTSIFNQNILCNHHHLNFVLRNWLSLNIAFLLGMFQWEFDATIAGFVALMLSEKPGAALLTNMGRMTGTVLGTLVGFVLYRALHSCDQVLEKCVALFFFEWIATFVLYYSDQFALLGALMAVFGGKILIMKCEENLTHEEHVVMQAAAYIQFHKLAVALGLVSMVDIIFLRRPASAMARESLLKAMNECFDLFKSCLETGESNEKDIKKMKREFDVDIAKAESFGTEAQQEPRWWKAPFKGVLFRQLCQKIRSIHLDLITIQQTFDGEMGQLLFDLISKKLSFPIVKQDVFQTIDDAERIVAEVLFHEQVGLIDFDVSDWTANLSVVDGLEDLIVEVQEELKNNPPKKASSMEDDLVCRLCVVCEMLDSVVKDIAGTFALCLENL